MKKKYVIVSVVVIAAMAIIFPSHLSSNRVVPLAGECGDPTNINACTPNSCTCSQGSCHPGNGHPQAASSNTLSLLIAPASNISNSVALNSSFQYLPNTTYVISFELHTDSNMNGFEFTVLDANNHMAGSFTRTDMTHTYLQTSSINNVQYMSHQLATNFLNWAFEWTAPAYSTGPVTFYYAYNTSDSAAEFINAPNTGIPEGVIYAGTTTISASTAGIAEIAGLTDLKIYPNPVSVEFGLSFNLKKSEIMSSYVYNIDGRQVKELMNNETTPAGGYYHAFDISDLPAGIYLLRLNSGEASMTEKIIKL